MSEATHNPIFHFADQFISTMLTQQHPKASKQADEDILQLQTQNNTPPASESDQVLDQYSFLVVGNGSNSTEGASICSTPEVSPYSSPSNLEFNGASHVLADLSPGCTLPRLGVRDEVDSLVGSSPPKSPNIESKLLYRVLKNNQEEDDNHGFEPRVNILVHQGKAINLVIGMSASGKTSMIQILAGGYETSVRTKSETQDPVLIFDQVNNKLWLDSAGMCDSSQDSERKALFRDTLLNAIKQHRFSVGRIFVCVACDQNIEENFPHEYTAFNKAFRGAENLTSVVITKVNYERKAKNINAEGGLKDHYAAAFSCSRDCVLLSGLGRFSQDPLAHAVEPSFKGGIHRNDIGTVTENAEVKQKLLDLEVQVEQLKKAKNERLSDKVRAEENIKALYKTIESAEDTLELLLSSNCFGWYNREIKNTLSFLKEAREEVSENERKLKENEISAVEASNSCDKTYFEMIEAKRDLEQRMLTGRGLAELAGAGKSFRQFFNRED